MAKAKSLKGTKTILLAQAVATPIRRHVKLKADAHPYSPEYRAYFEMREKHHRGRNGWLARGCAVSLLFPTEMMSNELFNFFEFFVR